MRFFFLIWSFCFTALVFKRKNTQISLGDCNVEEKKTRFCHNKVFKYHSLILKQFGPREAMSDDAIEEEAYDENQQDIEVVDAEQVRFFA